MKSTLAPEIGQLVQFTYRNGPATLAQLEAVKLHQKSIVVKLEQIRAAQPHSIVNLSGTFPITFKGVSYNLPLHVRVLPDFPASAPVVFLVPTPDMAIVKQHKNVDETGRCYFPYLSAWNPVNSTLVGLLNVMTETFSEHPPLYAKPKALPAHPPANEPVVRPANAAPIPVSSSNNVPSNNHANVSVGVSPSAAAAAVDDDDDPVDPKLCIVCMERPKEALLQPCNHVACCSECSNQMKARDQPCPVCRKKIESVIRVFVV